MPYLIEQYEPEGESWPAEDRFTTTADTLDEARAIITRRIKGSLNELGYPVPGFMEDEGVVEVHHESNKYGCGGYTIRKVA